MTIAFPEDVFVYDHNLSRNTNYALWYTMLCTERDNFNDPSLSTTEAKIIFDKQYPISE